MCDYLLLPVYMKEPCRIKTFSVTAMQADVCEHHSLSVGSEGILQIIGMPETSAVQVWLPRKESSPPP